MKKNLIQLASLFLALTIVSTSFAAPDKPVAGKVTAVAEGSITISSKKKGETTFKTGSETKVIKADGTAGTLGEIKSGARIRVTTASSPDQAGTIQIVEKKKDKAAGNSEE